jgi:hypothetical protein
MRSNLKTAFCAALLLLAAGLFGNDRAAAWWLLSFSGAPDIPHGTVTAMGFCAPVFLARPRWWFDDAGRVVIGHRHGDPLAVLEVGRGRLEGQIATGETVSLIR